ncbi:TetR/AcrR family transcriptional regulator [Nocardioides humilatus]|uniref:TetR/AcrR family transcriptional regulator n=1 Tax=Nocardioides humilatus TaxID=2607660 RepID=A0A5B1LF68_9ACTN|nr:TetR/AcrR family transcriptional regulator [Nocardioides humilatus]KAA1419292.1 TetR/AcrR family transcriptional regulator [Nocardioides humilatus]
MSIDTSIERILDAALEELAEGGARRTTMNQIADAAGLGVATVYRRFPRKAQLVEAVLVREAQRVIEAVDAAIGRAQTVEEQSAAGFTTFAHAVADRPFLVRLMRGDGELDGEAVRPGELADRVMVLVRDYIAHFVRDLQAEGRYLGVDADVVAEIQARLALSLVLAPDGRIPMHDDAATREFATKYLVPLLGVE